MPAITRSTADKLAGVVGLPTYVGMRHWRPLIEEVVPDMARSGLERALAICMAPQYSSVSVGAYHRRVSEATALHPSLRFDLSSSWHLQPHFVSGLAENVLGTIDRFDPGREGRGQSALHRAQPPERRAAG